ncbi:MAG: MinD/ParA family protein [Clostridiales bacterium]|nr:MinD/ParA family protein [Clostridiales bacterium]
MKNQADNLIHLVDEKRKTNDVFMKNSNVQIYTVASGKGGVGKTNIVVSLAISLQRAGKKVLVMDADLGLANVDILLGISPKLTLYDVMFKGRKIEDAIFEGPEGIKIIPGGSGILELSKMDVMEKRSFINQFKMLNGFDIILIDTGAGISMNQLSFITFSDEVILVTTPEPTAITDVYSVIKIISSLKLNRKINIVVNRVKDEKDALNTFNKLNETTTRFLGIELKQYGFVADDIRVNTSVMNQVPFIIKYPNCLASQCIDNLAKDIINNRKNKIKVKTMDEFYNRLLKVFG